MQAALSFDVRRGKSILPLALILAACVGVSSTYAEGIRNVTPSGYTERSTEPAHTLRKGAGGVHTELPPPGSGAMCQLERRMIAAGLVNVKDIDGTLLVDLKYASPQNFMGVAVYGDLKACYLQPEAALKLKRAHDALKAASPGLRLLVADGCRPRSVQRRMWEIVRGTPMQKYVANPAAGSMHNYAAAVDITLADGNGNRLDMGVPMDHFGILSHPREEQRLLRERRLTDDHVAHRKLLRQVMTQAGFQPLGIEWWHFNACARATVADRYRIVE